MKMTDRFGRRLGRLLLVTGLSCLLAMGTVGFLALHHHHGDLSAHHDTGPCAMCVAQATSASVDVAETRVIVATPGRPVSVPPIAAEAVVSFSILTADSRGPPSLL